MTVKGFLKGMLSALLILGVFFLFGRRSNPPFIESTPQPTEEILITPSPTIEMSENTDNIYDEILSENTLEMMLISVVKDSPITSPKVSLSESGSVEFSADLDVKKAVAEAEAPDFLRKLAQFGLIKGQVPLRFVGELGVADGQLVFQPNDAYIGGMSLSKVERLMGKNVLTDDTRGQINEMINEVVTDELQIKVAELDFGNGFMRLKGTRVG
jgi:hypothetical protein